EDLLHAHRDEGQLHEVHPSRVAAPQIDADGGSSPVAADEQETGRELGHAVLLVGLTNLLSSPEGQVSSLAQRSLAPVRSPEKVQVLLGQLGSSRSQELVDLLLRCTSVQLHLLDQLPYTFVHSLLSRFA